MKKIKILIVALISCLSLNSYSENPLSDGAHYSRYGRSGMITAIDEILASIRNDATSGGEDYGIRAYKEGLIERLEDLKKELVAVNKNVNYPDNASVSRLNSAVNKVDRFVASHANHFLFKMAVLGGEGQAISNLKSVYQDKLVNRIRAKSKAVVSSFGKGFTKVAGIVGLPLVAVNAAFAGEEPELDRSNQNVVPPSNTFKAYSGSVPTPSYRPAAQ